MSKDTAEEVIQNDERRPILYNHRGEPLVHEVGFKPKPKGGTDGP